MRASHGILQTHVVVWATTACGLLTQAIAREAAIENPPRSAMAVDFERQVRPIFERRCFSCHGPKKQQAGFRLDVKAVAFAGGDSLEPAIIPGHSAKSPLFQLVSGTNDAVMPPKGERLSNAEVAILRSWIDAGANWPDADRAAIVDRRDHWSFKPLRVDSGAGKRSTIDDFILARLEREGLRPAPPADRATWLRRATFDLTGLPPTPERLDAFLADHRPDAFERAVDELLASPRYGERWAQHWLDVVRFADTHGFEVNTERPNAWPYRDYVISALNDDTPYDRFIREQLVGDALGKDAATGFLVTASVLLPGQIGQDEPSKRLARQDALDEIVINAGQTFLGLSIGCARCHDHKFDPIPQRDYFAMQAFFAGVEYDDRPVRTAASEASRAQLPQWRVRRAAIERRLVQLEPLANAGWVRPPVHAKLNRDRFAPVKTRRLRFTVMATNNLEPCVDELEVFDESNVNVALASAGAKASASGQILVADRHELRFINDGLYGNSHSWLGNESGKGWVELEFPAEQTISRVAWSRDRDGQYADRLAIDYRIEVAEAGGRWREVASAVDRRSSSAKGKSLAKTLKEPDAQVLKEARTLADEWETIGRQMATAEVGQMVFAGRFRTPDRIFLLQRGDPEQPKAEVAPATPGILGSAALSKDAGEQDRRRALADWIASPRNALAARVMVNRIWQGHFGIGLVETASDFGNSGAKPSHPELLDWLAHQFVRAGWSIKQMHRLIVLSSTYRQSSRMDRAAYGKDADNRWLWRYPTRRLDAETVRDSMLAVAGRLNLKMGGPGFDLFDKRGGLTGFKPIESFSDEGRRRMIYSHRVRRERDAVFGALDCPDNGQSTARRRESTTPIQALNLFNSRFTADESAAFAARVQKEVGADAASQIARAYFLALGRRPTAEETSEAVPVVAAHGLATLCRVLFNANEFLYLP